MCAHDKAAVAAAAAAMAAAAAVVGGAATPTAAPLRRGKSCSSPRRRAPSARLHALRAECGEEASVPSGDSCGGVAVQAADDDRGAVMDATRTPDPPSPASLLDVGELDEDLDEDLGEDSFGNTYGSLCGAERPEPISTGGLVDTVVERVVDGALGLVGHSFVRPSSSGLCLDLEFHDSGDGHDGPVVDVAYDDVGAQDLSDHSSSLSADEGPCVSAAGGVMPSSSAVDSDTDTEMSVDDGFLPRNEQGLHLPLSVPHYDAVEAGGYKAVSPSSAAAADVEALSESSEESDPSSDSACSFLGSSLCLVDHDDTLLATTFVGELGLPLDGVDDDDERSKVPADVAASMSTLDELSEALILEALRHGPVRIVTNAEAGWVELSSARFLPRTAALLRQRNVRVISARTTYEARFPDMPTAWKVAAFADEIARTFPDARDRPADVELNVLVFGDSMSERHAAHAVARQLPRSRVKTVKFVERPDVGTLQRQLAHVTAVYGDLFVHDGSFDINTVC
ncbi:hypothetical protein MMPV_005172 [Pyropia vietnamensis]